MGKRLSAGRRVVLPVFVLSESVPGFSERLADRAKHQSSTAGAQSDRTSTTITLMVSANAMLLVTG